MVVGFQNQVCIEDLDMSTRGQESKCLVRSVVVKIFKGSWERNF